MALGGVLGGLTNNFVIEQIAAMNVLQPIVSAALNPMLVELVQTVNRGAPNLALSPADVARAVIRTAMTQQQGEIEAMSSGVNPSRFETILAITGNPPAPQTLAVALRRGFIDEAQYELGIRQGDLRNEYIELVKRMAVEQPSPQSALQAELEGQLSHAEALAKFAEFGGDPSQYEWLFNTQGSAPSPVELGVMANRKIIGWTGTGPDAVTFEQGFLEGPWRNKWLGPMRKLAEYVPPPRTVTAMLHSGAFTEAQALAIFEESGLSPEMAAAYVKAATLTKTAKAKELAESTVLALFEDKIVTRDQALAMTELLGYSRPEAEYIIEVAEFKTLAAAHRAAVSRVHTLFVGHKIDSATTIALLAEFDVPADRATALMEVWSAERKANVRILTEAQYVTAWGHAIIDTPTALSKLQELGYDADDALTLLANHNKGPLTPEQVAGTVDSKAASSGA